MLVAIAVLLIILGIVLNRLANRYFRHYGRAFVADPGERMMRDAVWLALQKWPPVLFALAGYFFGIFLVGYGLSILMG